MITFHSVTSKNFMAIGDIPITVNLDQHRVVGVRGKNSAGKSTIIESLTFALFGKSFRGSNKGQLVNTTNKKGTLVELDFTINHTKYKVSRGIKPDVFIIEKNGAPLDESAASRDTQSVLESILGFDYSMFAKTIALGYANYTPFMAMTAQQRRSFVESALGLGIFSDLNKIVKADASANQAIIMDVNKKLSIKQATLQTHEDHNATAKVAADSLVAEQTEKLTPLAASIRAQKQQIVDLVNEINQDNYDPAVHKTNRDVLVKYNIEFGAKRGDQNRLKSELKKVTEEINCPTCGTPFDEKHRRMHISDLTKNIDALVADLVSLEIAGKQTESAVAAFEQQRLALDHKQQELARMKYAYSNDVNQAKSIMANIDRLKAPMTLVDTLPLVDEINGLERDLGALLVKQEEYSIAVDLLKDTGIKASIIDKYIPVLNTKINEMLDLIGFGVRLKFDNSFNESLIGRYADEFSYTSLSQGERERMNLAIMFAWQQVMQMASGIDCNVLVLDEIGASALDDDGIDAMFTILEKTCLSKNVIIISHNKQALAQCPAIIDVRKENGFTKIS
jgi:DNA repair exonuclease SbcCD ATPase subunit